MSISERIDDIITSKELNSREIDNKSSQINSNFIKISKDKYNPDIKTDFFNPEKLNKNARNLKSFLENNSLSLKNTIDLILLSEQGMFLLSFLGKVKAIIEDVSSITDDKYNELKKEIIDNIRKITSIVWNKHSLKPSKAEKFSYEGQKNKLNKELKITSPNKLSFIGDGPNFSQIENIRKDILFIKEHIIKNEKNPLQKKLKRNCFKNNANNISYIEERKNNKMKKKNLNNKTFKQKPIKVIGPKKLYANKEELPKINYREKTPIKKIDNSKTPPNLTPILTKKKLKFKKVQNFNYRINSGLTRLNHDYNNSNSNYTIKIRFINIWYKECHF